MFKQNKLFLGVFLVIQAFSGFYFSPANANCANGVAAKGAILPRSVEVASGDPGKGEDYLHHNQLSQGANLDSLDGAIFVISKNWANDYIFDFEKAPFRGLSDAQASVRLKPMLVSLLTSMGCPDIEMDRDLAEGMNIPKRVYQRGVKSGKVKISKTDLTAKE